LTIISSLMAAAPVGAAVTPQKVVIIVGPTGGQTTDYRQRGDSYAATAAAAGATVVKVYSPTATWANVKAAVNGANIIIYLGHGNGFPNPYGTTELTDRHDGWGLNRTERSSTDPYGDSDNWSQYMVYCGEKVLRGLLTPSDDSTRLNYCGGTANDGITPAPNWVMIYSNACYAPGASEGSDVPATEAVALQRVRNFSYPALMVGAGAYFATDFGANGIVDNILRNPNMAFAEIAERANGYNLSVQRHFDHPDLGGYRIWIQNSGAPTSGSYKLAYAGRLGLTPSGSTVAYTEPVFQPALAATYSASPPTSWYAGQAQTYSITLTNTGTQTWNAGGSNPVRLGVSFGTSNDTAGVGWATDQRFSLPGDLAPGASVTLSLSVTPPAGTGSYVLRQRMVKEGLAWFEQMQKTSVTVAS
jgi:hypothetical protein